MIPNQKSEKQADEKNEQGEIDSLSSLSFGLTLLYY